MPIIDHPRVAYEIAGEGPPVLFIQGVGVPGIGWRPQVEGLSDGYRCVSFDNRGVGGSGAITGSLSIADMVGDTLALLDHLGWEDAHVVGHSLGGIIAHQLALDARRRVRSLSLLCTFTRGKDAARLTPWILSVGLRTRLGTARMRRRAFLEILLPASVTDRDAAAEKYAPFFGRDLADQHPTAMAQVMAMSKHDDSARLPEIAGIPTLVASAAEDRLALPDYGRRLASAIPAARYVELADASHGVPLTHPDTVNRLLREHLDGIEAARRSGDGLR